MGPTAQAQKIWIEVHVRHQGGTGNSLDYATPPRRAVGSTATGEQKRGRFISEGGR